MGIKAYIHRRLWPLLPRPLRRRALFAFMSLSAPRARGAQAPEDGPVYVAGFFSTASGLGRSARLCMHDMQACGRKVTGIDIGPDLLQPSDLARDAGILTASAPLPPGPGLVIVHVNAPFMAWANRALGRRFLDGKRIVGFWLWELPRIPDDWMSGFAFVDEIWVPSRFIQGAIAAHTAKPVKVVPYRLPEGPKSDRGFAQDGIVRVLNVFNMASGFTRKNALGTIQAFQEAFGPNGNAELIMKLMHPQTYPEGMEAIQGAIMGWENIQIIDKLLSEYETQSLYGNADIYLSLHRSEGFGLPLLEAKEKGLHVVATGWSGNMDFMDGERCHPVPYTLVPAHDPQGTYDHADMSWAEPDIQAAARILREIASRGAQSS